MCCKLVLSLTIVMSTILDLHCIPSEFTTNISTTEMSSIGIRRRVPRAAPKGHEPDEPAHTHEDAALADKLYQRVRILCWVMIYAAHHRAKAEHVKYTWGSRCNVLLFFSSRANDLLPTIVLPVDEGRDHSWEKTKAAFQYIYEHHRDDADWFLRADDDTYVIVENVRHLLSRYKSTEPLYFGCRFKLHVDQGYMNGGAGYVLSREALQLFINQGLVDNNYCKRGQDDNTTAEDVEIGKCLQKVGVRAMDSRDEYGRGRFFPDSPTRHLFPNPEGQPWYWDYSFYPMHKEGEAHVSDYAITFHNISPEEMYVFDYFLYHARPYGISRA